MVRACASQESKDFGHLFCVTVTAEIAKDQPGYTKNTVGRSGEYAIFDALQRCFPGAARTGRRDGVSQVELNKHLEKCAGFLRYRYRANNSSCYRYAHRRWRNPDDPVDMAFLTSLWDHVNAKGTALGEGCSLDKCCEILKLFSMNDQFDFHSCTVYEPTHARGKGISSQERGDAHHDTTSDSEDMSRNKGNADTSDESDGEGQDRNQPRSAANNVQSGLKLSANMNFNNSQFAGLNGLAGVALAAGNGVDYASLSSTKTIDPLSTSNLNTSENTAPMLFNPGNLQAMASISLNLFKILSENLAASGASQQQPALPAALHPQQPALLPGLQNPLFFPHLPPMGSAGPDATTALLAGTVPLLGLPQPLPPLADCAGGAPPSSSSSLPTAARGSAGRGGGGGDAAGDQGVSPTSTATTQSGSPHSTGAGACVGAALLGGLEGGKGAGGKVEGGEERAKESSAADRKKRAAEDAPDPAPRADKKKKRPAGGAKPGDALKDKDADRKSVV